MNEYTVILVIRNPYERLLSGYVDKYIDKPDVFIMPEGVTTFRKFILCLKNTPEKINGHHFCLQTSEMGWEWLENTGRNPDYIFFSR